MAKKGVIKAFPKTKRFNGKIYKLKETFGWKADFINFRYRMRNLGYYVRLAQKKGMVAHRYAMYIRKK